MRNVSVPWTRNIVRVLLVPCFAERLRVEGLGRGRNWQPPPSGISCKALPDPTGCNIRNSSPTGFLDDLGIACYPPRVLSLLCCAQASSRATITFPSSYKLCESELFRHLPSAYLCTGDFAGDQHGAFGKSLASLCCCAWCMYSTHSLVATECRKNVSLWRGK